jgi:hypothetical protein
VPTAQRPSHPQRPPRPFEVPPLVPSPSDYSGIYRGLYGALTTTWSACPASPELGERSGFAEDLADLGLALGDVRER